MFAPFFIQTDFKRDYERLEYRIPMRDGVRLYTAIFVPKHVPGKHPILLERTPYSVGPYTSTGAPEILGSPKFREKGYIFAEQDVRGQYMSEGTFMNIRPMLAASGKGRLEKGTDESTDAYDTIDYLVKHVPDNNGAVGMWGISYPGFYAAAGGINSHPALKAISPQAPCSDWFVGDDIHHNGAFFTQDNFDFSVWFDLPRKGLEKEHKSLPVNRGGLSAYDFFLRSESLADLAQKYVKGRIPFWQDLMDHGVDDAFWKARSLPGQLKNVNCAVMTVGGWFDAEDQWGALNDPPAIRRLNPKTPNFLVMGPWFHGMWADAGGESFGDLSFGMPTSQYYRDNIEFPFFEHYLRGQDVPPPAAATMFQTGVNRWRTFPEWPPKDVGRFAMYLGESRTLLAQPATENGADEYENDPAHPTPYMADLNAKERPTEYMIDDQRWASARPDVVSYRGDVLTQPVTVAGPIDVDLMVQTSGSDADFIVKVIDIWPADSKQVSPRGASMASYEQLLRGDVMRGKFRNSLSEPEPIEPGKPTRIHYKLNDVLHTFLPGHRIMVQIQSSWFPLVDQNPNRFEDIYHAKLADFQKEKITIFHGPKLSSKITFGTLGG